jgi:hypothetical protein
MFLPLSIVDFFRRPDGVMKSPGARRAGCSFHHFLEPPAQIKTV